MPVYFIQALEIGDIKIGWANNVDARLRALQTANSLTLVIVGIERAPRQRKKELHQQFRAFHKRGEWYYPSPQLRSYVRNYSIGDAVPVPAPKDKRKWEKCRTIESLHPGDIVRMEEDVSFVFGGWSSRQYPVCKVLNIYSDNIDIASIWACHPENEKLTVYWKELEIYVGPFPAYFIQ